jgi:hypothetical protein
LIRIQRVTVDHAIEEVSVVNRRTRWIKSPTGIINVGIHRAIAINIHVGSHLPVCGR